MTHTAKAALFLDTSASMLRLALTLTGEERKDMLVAASNYANLAAGELAVEHSDFCQSK